ncbi:hypothetical protein V6N11_023343 [Hibiscus sabdariffa]|uniref:Uncharacterized protein n=1 Tax=Hibiscus sabdariffa TaxID=183260 RepID=A0ABR2TMA0_9ROSI
MQAVDGSRSSNVLLHHVQRNSGGGGIRVACRFVTDSEDDLPNYQVGEKRRWRRQERVLRQERLNVGPKRRGKAGSGSRGREGEEVVEVGRYSPLHSLRGQAVDYHSVDGGAWVGFRARELRSGGRKAVSGKRIGEEREGVGSVGVRE